MFKTKKLYAKDGSNNIRVWSIGADSEGNITIKHGVLGGIMQVQNQYVQDGLAGRTQEEQIHLIINSKIKNKMDNGYVGTKEKAMMQERVNSLGLQRPMLAMPVKSIKEFPDVPMFWQYKYNGNRCLVTKQRGEVIAYTRKGLRIDTITEIMEELDAVLEDGDTIDGELYCHGYKLQTLNSWIKKRQENTERLQLHIYDVMMQENFSVRFDWLRARIKPVESNKIKLAPTLTASLESLDEALKGAVEDGYEGVILRLDNSPYQAGKRSKAVIKVKQFYDDEFLVVDITPSTEGHAILHCVTKDGAKFKCSAPGNHMQRAETFENKDEYLGRYVQIKYQEFSKDKKPIPPVAMRWRDPSED